MNDTQVSQAAAIMAKAKAAAAAPEKPATTVTTPRHPREVRHAPTAGPALHAGRLQPTRRLGRVSVT